MNSEEQPDKPANGQPDIAQIGTDNAQIETDNGQIGTDNEKFGTIPGHRQVKKKPLDKIASSVAGVSKKVDEANKKATMQIHSKIDTARSGVVTSVVQEEVVDKGPAYFKSRSGILKIAQVVVSLLTAICSYSQGRHRFYADQAQGGSWVEFTAVSASIFGVIIIVVYLFDVFSKLPPAPKLPATPKLPVTIPKLPVTIPSITRDIVELVYLLVYTFFYLLCIIIAGSFATGYTQLIGTSAAGAAAFFSTVGMCVYGADAIIKFLMLRAACPSDAATETFESTP